MARVLMAGDHAGYELRQFLIGRLRGLGHEVVDLGSSSGTEPCDYPDFALPAAERVAAGEGVGILVCGTGMGVAIVANKVPGVRAARCTDTFSARMARAFLETPFEGGRHQRRVDKITALDARRGART